MLPHAQPSVQQADLPADHLRRQLLPPCWQAQTWHAQVSAVSVPLPAAAGARSNLLHVTRRSCTPEQCPCFRVPGTGLPGPACTLETGNCPVLAVRPYHDSKARCTVCCPPCQHRPGTQLFWHALAAAPFCPALTEAALCPVQVTRFSTEPSSSSSSQKQTSTGRYGVC